MNEQRLQIGTSVVTTRDAGAMDWREGARPNVRWGVRGVVVAVHDSHGLVYDVKHEDGSIAPYEPSELDNVSVAVGNEKPAEDPKRRDYRDGKLRELLIEAGFDMTDDAILAGVNGLVSDRKMLMDANSEFAQEVRRLAPAQVEARVLREEVMYLRTQVSHLLEEGAKQRDAMLTLMEKSLAVLTTSMEQRGLLERDGDGKIQPSDRYARPAPDRMRRLVKWIANWLRDEEREKQYDEYCCVLPTLEATAEPVSFREWLAEQIETLPLPTETVQMNTLVNDGTTEGATVDGPTRIVHVGGGGGGARGHLEYGPGGGGGARGHHGTQPFSDRVQPFGVVRRANGAIEPVQFELRAHDDRYVTKEPLVISADDRLYLQPPPPRTDIDIRRVLTLVAAYLDPSAPLSYGRFVELLRTVPGLQGLSYSDIYPVLFNVQACTHPKSSEIDDLAMISDCGAYGREICAEFGIKYEPVCTCLDVVGDPNEPANHGVFCPKKGKSKEEHSDADPQ